MTRDLAASSTGSDSSTTARELPAPGRSSSTGRMAARPSAPESSADPSAARSEAPALDDPFGLHLADAGGGGATATATAPAALAAFATAFNREFAAQLHVFAEGSTEAAAERGRDVSAAEVGAASGDAVPPEVLGRLFSSTQITKLTQFCADHIIPERLFNGDDVGATSAQQRILLAGHILAAGTYRPGSFEQMVHARMCGHWVNLVMHYAGCAEGGGAGVREEFDHTGGLSLGVSGGGDSGEPLEGTSRDSLGGDLGVGRRHEAAPGASALFELGGLPFENITMLEPGDWLWVYNDNGSPGGNHSLVFSRWASGDDTFQGVRFRRAITMSQISPDAGGREETRLFGERFIDTGHGRITPVTHISRVDATARPLQTAEDLIAILGSGSEATDNHRFIERQLHGHGRFDWDALAAHLRERNAAMIGQLASHMTAHQRTAFTETNQPTGGDGGSAGEALIPRLVRLHERLTVLVDNAGALDAGMAAQHDGIEGHRAERLDETRDDRERAERTIATLEHELGDLEHQLEPLAATVDDYAEHTAELRAAYVERRSKRARRGELREALHDASLPQAEREALATELGTVNDRLEALAPIIERLEDEENDRDVRADRREARRAERAIEVQIRQRTARLVRAEHDLAALAASAGYYTAHGRVARDDFNGVGEARRPTGLLRNVTPAPAWSTFIRPAEGGGGA